MVEYCKGQAALKWLSNVIVALSCTGLRIGELVALRWTDVHVERGYLELTDETSRPSSTSDKRELKSGRSRSFPIHPTLLKVLSEPPHAGKFIFYGPRGGRLKADTVRRTLVRNVIEPLAEKFPAVEGGKGFRDGRPHSFRHFFCTTCANNGVAERVLMDWLGHSDSEMIKHYYHLHDAEARRQMESLDFLGGSDGRSGADSS